VDNSVDELLMDYLKPIEKLCKALLKNMFKTAGRSRGFEFLIFKF